MSRTSSEIAPKSEGLRIGRARYDPATGALTGADGVPVHLRRQSAQVLAALAAQVGEVVRREALVDRVWDGVATTDDSLVQCIGDIRRALGRDAVETYPKIGYRLVATDAPSPGGAGGRPRRRGPVLVAVALVTALALGSGPWLIQGPRGPGVDGARIVPPQIVREKSLAVLPFVNLGDDDMRFFGDGLSEDLATDLSKISGLTVIAFASSGDFPQAEAGFRDIADDLGVRYLVRGTIRHSGERIRINASLIDPFEGVNLWAERFDRVRQDPFDVQEGVTRAIVEALSLSLEVDPAPLPVEPDAYFMLLRGLEPLRENTPDGNRRARDFFAKALDLDPAYARAHAYVALTHGRDTMFDYSGSLGQRSVRDGLDAAITAIRLDPTLPTAYLALAVLNLAIGEHGKALSAARHSIKLNRNFADGYAILAEARVHGGDLHEALEAIRHAKRLHPHHPAGYDWIEGHVQFQLGHAEAARRLLETTVETAPDFVPPAIILAAAYVELGEPDRARSVLASLNARKPGVSIDEFLDAMRYTHDARRARLADAFQSLNGG